ncbi:MAG TPA: hypothetical protein VJU18_16115 [Vicinamibacteria bacterium]|nr:hypothetical protein [Vicinamibacteria bacterium]
MSDLDPETERHFWEGWLGEALSSRLVDIRQRVESVYVGKTANPDHPQLRWFTPHGPTHYRAVEDLMHQLIPRQCHERLTESEKFFLLASAWLHDLGMIRGLWDGDGTLSDDQIREQHHVRSERYLATDYQNVGVRQPEAAAFGVLSRLHRRRCPLEECRDPRVPVPGHGELRLRLLGAYLRLADALHVDLTRAPDDQYAISLTYDIPNASKLHWLRSMFVMGIKIDTDAKEIVVLFKCPTPAADPAETERMKRVVQGVAELVVDDLSSELDSVKDVLFAADISYFLRVRAEFQEVELSAQLRRDLATAMSDQFLLDNPSSSALFTLLVDSLQDIMEARRPDVAGEVDRFLADIERRVLKSRRCHTGLRNLVAAVKDKWQRRDVPALASWIRDQKGAWAQKRQALRRQAFEYFYDSLAKNRGRSLDQPCAVLLYGYSEQVIEALCGFKEAVLQWLRIQQVRAFEKSGTGVATRAGDDEQAAQHFRLFVCEGQPKNRTGWGARVLFHDGTRYAVALAGRGFRDISIIPDAIACTLMVAPSPRPQVDFLMVGANGFDDHRFFHAAGHTMVVAGADFAKRQTGAARPAVVLVVTTDKHGPLQPAAEPRPQTLVRDGWRFRGSFADEPVRDQMFICQDPRLHMTLAEAGVLLYNPREDQVPIDLVDVVITERRYHRRDPQAAWSGAAFAAATDSGAEPARGAEPLAPRKRG